MRQEYLPGTNFTETGLGIPPKMNKIIIIAIIFSPKSAVAIPVCTIHKKSLHSRFGAHLLALHPLLPYGSFNERDSLAH